jgi:hypothetical protein
VQKIAQETLTLTGNETNNELKLDI